MLVLEQENSNTLSLKKQDSIKQLNDYNANLQYRDSQLGVTPEQAEAIITDPRGLQDQDDTVNAQDSSEPK